LPRASGNRRGKTTGGPAAKNVANGRKTNDNNTD